MAERTEAPPVESKNSDSAPASARVRNRLARIGGKSGSSDAVLDPLFKVYPRRPIPRPTVTLDRSRPTEVAERYHRGQQRKSGDPYIPHPVAVTTILAEFGLTVSTLCAALLHDTVEDTDYTLAAADGGLRRGGGGAGRRGDEARQGQLRRRPRKAETIRKMVVAMSRDIRVLVIKLADRLHNMRTLRYLRPASRQRIARETLEIYAPLAHRLGMNTIKWELEDLSFATLYPKVRRDRAAGREAGRRGATSTSPVIERRRGGPAAGKIKAR